VLVEYGANVNTPREDGCTPVLMAAQNGHHDTIKLLYKLGADMNPPSSDYSIAALANNHTKSLQLIGKILKKIGKECACCGSSSKRVKLCSKCRKVSYCSRQCQLQDYKQHKKDCRSADSNKKVA
jgi:hypothetical protein